MTSDNTVTVSVSEYDALRSQLAEAQAELASLRDTFGKNENDIEQTLGRALGYPWYKDDHNNFPMATEHDGVCVGEHTAATIAAEAANRLASVQAELADLKAAARRMLEAMENSDAEGRVLIQSNGENNSYYGCPACYGFAREWDGHIVHAPDCPREALAEKVKG